MKYLHFYKNYLIEGKRDNKHPSNPNNDEHYKALKKTGFWGRQGAGCLVLSRETKRILIPHRSPYVLQPSTWGVWGGAIDSEEIPINSVKRELEEEAGYSGSVKFITLSVYQQDNFKYHNFLAIVESEFIPQMNWETDGYLWTSIDELPKPLHFGLEWLLEKDGLKIRDIIKNLYL